MTVGSAGVNNARRNCCYVAMHSVCPQQNGHSIWLCTKYTCCRFGISVLLGENHYNFRYRFLELARDDIAWTLTVTSSRVIQRQDNIVLLMDIKHDCLTRIHLTQFLLVQNIKSFQHAERIR